MAGNLAVAGRRSNVPHVCTAPQFSIDETLEFDLYYYDGGVPGSDVLSKQLEAFNTANLPYRCGRRPWAWLSSDREPGCHCAGTLG